MPRPPGLDLPQRIEAPKPHQLAPEHLVLDIARADHERTRQLRRVQRGRTGRAVRRGVRP
jgi:hypothetical protein